MRDSVEVAERVPAAILQLELEATVTAHALNCRRLNQSHKSSVRHKHQALEFRCKILHDICGGVPLAAPLGFRLGSHVHHALVGCGATSAESDEFEHPGNVRIRPHDCSCLVNQGGRVGQ